MLANAITDYLKSLNVVPPGFAVRTGRLAATEERGVMVMFSLGGMTDAVDQSGYYEGNQQIIVRSPDPMEVDTICKTISGALKVIGKPVRLDDQYRLQMFKPRGLPITYPINDADYYEGSINFDARATVSP